jgi:hypothetical protein
MAMIRPNVSKWADALIRTVSVDLAFGRFDEARARIVELEKRGLFYEHADRDDITIDSFVMAVFSERLSCGLERYGIFTFRHVCQKRADQLRGLTRLPQRELEELIDFCRERFARTIPRVTEVDE